MPLHSEGHLLHEDVGAAPGGEDAEGLPHQAAPRDPGDAHTAEVPKSQAEVAKPQELQVSQDQVAQVSTAVGSPPPRVALWVMLQSPGRASS